MKKLKEYLTSIDAQIIGVNYTDIIVDDSNAFLDFVYHNNYRVYEILWWEKAMINGEKRQSIGCGGPINLKDNRFFWSETELHNRFDDTVDIYEIKRYIEEVSCAYVEYYLVPSFSVVKTKE